MPEPTGCDDLKAALDAAQEAYDTAWWAETAAELVWLGTGAATVAGGAAALACWTAGEAATAGTATPGCGWMTAGVAGGAAATAGAYIQAQQAQEVREKAEAARDAAEAAYCDCLRGETSDAGDLPEVPEEEITFTEDEVEEIVGDPLDEEDGDGEECECEEGDPYDELDDYGMSEESDDAEMMSFYDPAAAP